MTHRIQAPHTLVIRPNRHELLRITTVSTTVSSYMPLFCLYLLERPHSRCRHVQYPPGGKRAAEARHGADRRIEIYH